MRVTVDCYALQSESSKHRGIGSYSRDLLITLLQSSSLLEVTLLANSRKDYSELENFCREEFLSKRTSIRLWDHGMDKSEILNYSDGYWRAQEIYLQVVNSTRPDKYLQLSPFEFENPWAVPIGVYNIAVFYDAIPAIYPNRYLENPKTKKLYFETVKKLNSFDELLCISNSSKIDASAVLGLTNPKKTTINFGLQTMYRENPYIGISKDPKLAFAVLGGDERKNQKNLLRAWARCCEEHPDLQIAIAYNHSEAQKNANESLLKELKLENNVKFLGFISNDEILKYYALAAVNIFPSYYEGLGLPVLEAYAAGTASLVSNRSSLPELCVDPRLQFNPDDVEEISLKILNFLSDKTIAKDALRHGTNMLERFTPELQRKQIRKIFTKGKISRHENPNNSSLEKIVICTPLLPEETGIADFFNPVIHSLHVKKEIVFVRNQVSANYYQCPECPQQISVIPKDKIYSINKEKSVFVYNIGNSSFHILSLSLIQEFPGVVILHDVSLSGLMRVAEQADNPESDMGNLVLKGLSTLNGISSVFKKAPFEFIHDKRLNRIILENATSIIVHNDRAKELVKQDFALIDESAICVTSLPVDPRTITTSQNSESNTICIFGRIANSKMFEEIIEAWKISKTGNSGRYQLVFVGQIFSPDFETCLKEAPEKFRISHIQEFSKNVYQEFLSRAIIAIQLRRSDKGESSGAIIDVMRNSIPLITNDRNLMNDISESYYSLIPKDFLVEQLSNCIDLTVENLPEYKSRAVVAAQQLQMNNQPEKYVEKILKYAETSLHRQKLFPISIAKSLSKEGLLGSSKQIRATLDACVDSFPPIFSLRRLIIIFNPDTLQFHGGIPQDITSALEKFVNVYNFPIFLVVKVPGTTYCRTVNNLMLPQEMISRFGLEEIVVKIRHTDMLLSKDINRSHNLFSEAEWNELKKSLSPYLEAVKIHI